MVRESGKRGAVAAKRLHPRRHSRQVEGGNGAFWRSVLLVGGLSEDGSDSGPFYANSNNAWSNANSNIGARHTT